MNNLTGTEKQIAWANEIRDRLFRATSTDSIIAAIQNMGDKLTEADIDRALAKHGELTEETIGRIIAEAFAAHTSASWWIEHRAETSLTNEVVAAIFA